MEIISGKEISKEILNNIKSEVSSRGIVPGLAVVLVGQDKASHIYVDLKEKAAKEVGIRFDKFLFDENDSEDLILDKIKELNRDDRIHGIIVQLPLPGKFDTQKIINAISPKKDVDGFHPDNIEAFFENRSDFMPVFPSAIVKMVKASLEGNFSDKEAIVIANSDRFGGVMCSALNREGVESKYVFCSDVLREKPSGSLIEELREADVIVTACGVLNLIDSSMVKDSVVVIDGGIVKKDGKVFGDAKFNSFEGTNCKVSPVPGGVGPMTVACLLENVYLMSVSE
ncbi:bifunctional 5,10-methylenetetrahydrofolate dehydrogenase/5,10-methenyltetrahydrofolate cyclohydrolase [Patescibacteria group bacterium]